MEAWQTDGVDFDLRLQDDMRSLPTIRHFQAMLNPQIQQLRDSAEAGKPEAQFLLSQICLQNKDFEGMVHWLLQASAKGLADALDALGHCYEKGQGVPRDLVAALEHYDRAVQAGSSFAAWHKAELLYKSKKGPDSQDQICELLVTAARANVVPALRAVGYLAMQLESSRGLAIECLRKAALQGDPASSFNLGWCLQQGWCGDESKHEAAVWLQQAAGAQYPFAEILLSSIAGVHHAPHAQNPEKKIEFGEPFALYPELQGVDHEVMSEDPAITLFKNVLNVVDCAYLMFLSRPYLKRANVIDPDSKEDGMVSDVRTSMSTYLPFEVVDMIGRYVELKIIRETGEDLLSSEPMSILCYAPGEYYRPHVDFFDPKLTVSKQLLQDGGQRTASAVTILTAPSQGGGTSFPRLNLTVPAVTGGTLWFRNCDVGGQVDERTLHAGDTVEKGEKWVVTKWFREKPTRYLEI